MLWAYAKAPSPNLPSGCLRFPSRVSTPLNAAGFESPCGKEAQIPIAPRPRQEGGPKEDSCERRRALSELI